MPPARLSAVQKDEARRLYVENPEVSVNALAASYGVGRTVMLRVLEGVTRPKGGQSKTTTRTETMIRMRDEGMTYDQIGKQVGISGVAVYKRIQKHNENKKKERN